VRLGQGFSLLDDEKHQHFRRLTFAAVLGGVYNVGRKVRRLALLQRDRFLAVRLDHQHAIKDVHEFVAIVSMLSAGPSRGDIGDVDDSLLSRRSFDVGPQQLRPFDRRLPCQRLSTNGEHEDQESGHAARCRYQLSHGRFPPMQE